MAWIFYVRVYLVVAGFVCLYCQITRIREACRLRDNGGGYIPALILLGKAQSMAIAVFLCCGFSLLLGFCTP